MFYPAGTVCANNEKAVLLITPVYLFSDSRVARMHAKKKELLRVNIGLHICSVASGKSIEPLDDSEIPIDDLANIGDIQYGSATWDSAALSNLVWLNPWNSEKMRKLYFADIVDQNTKEGEKPFSLYGPEYYHLRGSVGELTGENQKVLIWPSHGQIVAAVLKSSTVVRRELFSFDEFFSLGEAGFDAKMAPAHVRRWLDPLEADSVRREHWRLAPNW